MPKLKNRLPRLCRDRKLAISWYNGKRIYHGVWGTPDAEKNYKRFIAALLEVPDGVPVLVGENTEVIVSELATAYLDTIEKSRMHPSHISHFKRTIGFLVEIYGETVVNDFSPKKLKVVRDQMVKSGKLCRKVVNDYTCRIIRIFAWGVEEELAKTDTKALREVKPLQEGETGTFDHPERQEVPDAVIEATLPFLAPTVSAMVQVQRLTGMRPSEVFSMRVGDIDQSRSNGLRANASKF
jgi:integrase